MSSALRLCTIPLVGAFALAAGLGASSCYLSKSGTSSDGGTDPSCPGQGTARCPCFPNGTCMPGLTCLSEICVAAPGAAAEPDAAGIGSTVPVGAGGTIVGGTMDDGGSGMIGIWMDGSIVLGGGGTAASIGTGGSTGSTGAGGFPGSGSGNGIGGNGIGGNGVAGSTSVTGGGGTVNRGGSSGVGGTLTGTSYTGTLTAVSTTFNNGFASVSTGGTLWQGYAYAYAYNGATATPSCANKSDICYKTAGAHVCANGTILDSNKAGAGIGWTIAQPTEAEAGAINVSRGLTLQIATNMSSSITSKMRVSLVTPRRDSEDALIEYCARLPTTALTGPTTIPYYEFYQDCWDSTSTAQYEGDDPIKSIQIYVPGTSSAEQSFDFCIVSIAPY